MSFTDKNGHLTKAGQLAKSDRQIRRTRKLSDKVEVAQLCCVSDIGLS